MLLSAPQACPLSVRALLGICTIGFACLLAGMARANGPTAVGDAGPRDGGLRTTAVTNPWGGASAGPGNASPVSGSVSKSNKGWLARLFNNSQNAYSVDFKIVQKGKDGSVVKSDSFSAALRPMQTIETTAPMAPGAISAEFELGSWRKTDPK